MAVTYESIVLLHAEEAAAAIGILNDRGEQAVLDHLKQWHEPGEGTLVSTRDNPWKRTDTVYELDRYVIYVNEVDPYIGLLMKISI